MNVVTIIAHPHKDSHTRHGFNHAVSLLDTRGIGYDVIDLYADAFDATKDPMSDSPELVHYRNRIDNADRILVFFPIWWNAAPAILKGFFDRVFISGWAFHYERRLGLGVPVGHLKDKRAAIVTTSGAPNILHQLVQGARAARVVANDTLGFTGMRTKSFNTGGCETIDDNRDRVERTVNRAISWLVR